MSFNGIDNGAFHINDVLILHRICDVAGCWSKIANLNLPLLFLVPP